jgi:hypothetical protein
MKIHGQVFKWKKISLGHELKPEIVGCLYANNIFTFNWNCWTIFHSDYIIVQTHQ